MPLVLPSADLLCRCGWMNGWASGSVRQAGRLIGVQALVRRFATALHCTVGSHAPLLSPPPAPCRLQVGMKCVALAGRHPVYELSAADLVVRDLAQLSFINLKQLFAAEERVSRQVGACCGACFVWLVDLGSCWPLGSACRGRWACLAWFGSGLLRVASLVWVSGWVAGCGSAARSPAVIAPLRPAHFPLRLLLPPAAATAAAGGRGRRVWGHRNGGGGRGWRQHGHHTSHGLALTASGWHRRAGAALLAQPASQPACGASRIDE